MVKLLEFEAKIVSGLAIWSSSSSTDFFSGRDSGTHCSGELGVAEFWVMNSGATYLDSEPRVLHGRRQIVRGRKCGGPPRRRVCAGQRPVLAQLLDLLRSAF